MIPTETTPIRTQTIFLETGTKNRGDSRFVPVTLPHQRFHLERMAVLTGDNIEFTNQMLDRIFGANLPADKREEALKTAASAWDQHKEIVDEAFPGRGVYFSERQIARAVNYFVGEAITTENGRKRIVVHNDRFAASPELEQAYPGRVYRFHSTRIPGTINNNTGDRTSITVPRAGEPPFETQLADIEKKIEENHGVKLNETEIVIADDTTATNGTERRIAQRFIEQGAEVDTNNSIYSYVVFIGDYDPARDRRKSAGRSERRALSAEQRELGPHGGPTTKIGEHVALQQASQYPWGDGTVTRIDGFANRAELDQRMLQIFLDTYAPIEESLYGTTRSDGSTFKYFSFGDFRWMIPNGPHFGPSEAIRDYTRKNGRPPSGLHDLSFLDYIRLGLQRAKEASGRVLVEKTVLDLDGTVLGLKYEDPTKKSFGASSLGRAVTDNFEHLMTEYVGGDGDRIPEVFGSTDFESPTQLLRDNPEFAQYLIDQYGKSAMQRLQARFDSFYGPERGQEELEKFVEGHEFLPPGYHVLRELTWGNIDMNSVYKLDAGKTKEFVGSVVEKGSEIIILTAGPRIHAMRMIEAAGIKELVVNGTIVLVTVEDLYDPQTLHELGKEEVLRHLITHEPGDANSFGEFARRGVYGVKDNHANGRTAVVESSLAGTNRVHPGRLLAIGDQPHSDARAAIRVGGKGIVVDGPFRLDETFNYVDFIPPTKATTNGGKKSTK